MVQEKWDHVLICEDDVVLTRNLESNFQKGIKEIGNTEVKNQGNTGTCWSFSSLSFLHALLELLLSFH